VTFTYTYNTAARLTGISTNFVDPSHPGTLLSSAHYTPFGAPASSTFGNGIGESFGYDKRLRQQSYTATSGGTTQYSFNISSFAPNGDILSGNDSVNGTWTYSYDEMNRLCNANQSSTQPVCHQSALYTYDYDRFGNRWHQNGPQSSQLGFDSNNHIVGVTGLGYDASGDLTSDRAGTGSHQYFYDAENRIIQVDGTLGSCSTATACYVYDAEGRRVRRTTPGGAPDFLYDTAGRKVAEIDTTATFQRGELYAGNRHIAVYTPDPGPSRATFFIHADWLGTERTRTNMTGTACETITSLPFGDGQTISDSCGDSAGDVSPMHFTGKEWDAETGLDFLRARFFSAALGRFTSPDWSAKPQPIPYADLTDPQTLNLYAYMRNNPLRGIDPDGHAGSDCAPSTPGCQNGTQLTTVGAPLQPSRQNRAAADKNPARLVVNESSGDAKGGEIDYTLQKARNDTNDYRIVQAETNKDRTSKTEFGDSTSKGPNANEFPDTIQPGILQPASNSIQTFYMVPIDKAGKPLGAPQPVNVRDRSGNDFYGLGVYFSGTRDALVNGRQVTSRTFTPPQDDERNRN